MSCERLNNEVIEAEQAADARARAAARRLRDDATEVLTDNADLKCEQTELHGEIVRLEAELTKAQGDAEALRTALEERGKDVHFLSHQGGDFELDEPGWKVCPLAPCLSDRAAPGKAAT